MKTKAVSATLALVFCASLPTAVWASPCDTLVCMMGKAAGQSGGDGCNQPIKDFFSIKRFHRGDFDPDPTSNARRDFLNQCPDAQHANAGNVDQIIGLFGKVE
ncbi:TrbM/KikA/MpfK family conjugal transfer protein [Burkholderia pseudomallei]|uniref:TrbM/KikA/MpfK family conjugal transfer protein n=1 Tax=Burkholderia pseudomallei TaxID=28450 RepID=UPI00097737DF|nr:TrbM/KikA/MpfK family conjugal transfer protein [Burkholderia pseudomallei]